MKKGEAKAVLTMGSCMTEEEVIAQLEPEESGGEGDGGAARGSGDGDAEKSGKDEPGFGGIMLRGSVAASEALGLSPNSRLTKMRRDDFDRK